MCIARDQRSGQLGRMSAWRDRRVQKSVVVEVSRCIGQSLKQQARPWDMASGCALCMGRKPHAGSQSDDDELERLAMSSSCMHVCTSPAKQSGQDQTRLTLVTALNWPLPHTSISWHVMAFGARAPTDQHFAFSSLLHRFHHPTHNLLPSQ